jgi:hypothetical protein
MTNYLVIEDNKVVNVIVADTAKIAAEVTGKEVLESISPEPWINWTRSGDTWTAPVEEEIIDAELIQGELE